MISGISFISRITVSQEIQQLQRYMSEDVLKSDQMHLMDVLHLRAYGLHQSGLIIHRTSRQMHSQEFQKI